MPFTKLDGICTSGGATDPHRSIVLGHGSLQRNCRRTPERSAKTAAGRRRRRWLKPYRQITSIRRPDASLPTLPNAGFSFGGWMVACKRTRQNFAKSFSISRPYMMLSRRSHHHCPRISTSRAEIASAMNRLQPSKAMPARSAPAALWKRFRQDLAPLIQRQFVWYLRPGVCSLPEAWALCELVLLPKPGKALKIAVGTGGQDPGFCAGQPSESPGQGVPHVAPTVRLC